MSRLLARDVALLAMRLDRLVGGVLDGPVGDPALRRHVADEPVRTAPELVRRSRDLLSALPQAGLPPRRERYVAAQLTALECRARLAAGDRMPFAEQTSASYGVTIRPEDPDRYREAHRRLGEVLPGRGPLAARVATYRHHDVLPPDRLHDAVVAMAACLRERTAERIGLPAGETVEFDVVDGRPWTAFTRHLGAGRSRVLVNTASRVRRGQLLPLVAHEVYPGHHTQHCRAVEAGVALPELRLRLVHSPQGLLTEGAAEMAHHVLPGPGWGRVAEHVLSELGLTLDGELAEAVEAALDGLGRVRQDAALMRYAAGAGPDEVLAHLTRWLLIDDARARRMLVFLEHPQWRGYATTYAEGRPLVAAWLARPGSDPVGGLRRLLDEPFTPGDLRERTVLSDESSGPSTPVAG